MSPATLSSSWWFFLLFCIVGIGCWSTVGFRPHPHCHPPKFLLAADKNLETGNVVPPKRDEEELLRYSVSETTPRPYHGATSSSSSPSQSLSRHQRQVNRRLALSLVGGTASSLLVTSWDGVAHAAATTTAAATANPLQVLPNVKVTHRVAMNVRISRSDGTFYVRDDLDESNPDNRVFTGRLVLGLFGTVAPVHVQQFLRYVAVPPVTESEDEDDGPLPSYSRSLFTSLDQATGLLGGGVIPGYNLVSIGGSSALQYGKRLLEAPLWIETAQQQQQQPDLRISHSALSMGLLTHKSLDVQPTFGITTRKCGAELDATHVVFGQVLPDGDNNEALAFLQRCKDLPTYSMDRPSTATSTDAEGMALEQVASQVYSFQKDLFRSAAKSFGDSRLEKVYEGKLLRRVEVTNVQLLSSRVQ